VSPYTQRQLTPEQSARAEDAVRFVGVCVRSFLKSCPSYRKLARVCDFDSAARMAVVEASFTYDPAKSQPQTYYGSAVRHALLKEVRRYQRSREGADERVSLERAMSEAPAQAHRQAGLECLACLPDEERRLVEAHVLEGHSMLAIGRQIGRDWRTVKARLRRALRRLSDCVASGQTTADNRSPSP